jgi:predicted AAA+ superfamily ATPase
MEQHSIYFMLKRLLDIEQLAKAGKVLIIYGPRRVGKTTRITPKKDKGLQT